jgi:hypothetical protein
MNSFKVIAVGNLATDPEFGVKGETTYARICLVGNDYAGKDEQGNAREAVTSLWFVAFESLAEAIAKKCAQRGSADSRGADTFQQLDRQARREAVRLFVRHTELQVRRTRQGEARGIRGAAR